METRPGRGIMSRFRRRCMRRTIGGRAEAEDIVRVFLFSGLGYAEAHLTVDGARVATYGRGYGPMSASPLIEA